MGKGVGAGREPEPVPVVATREACYDPSTSGRRVPYGRHYERHFPDRGRSFHPDWNDLKGARSGQRAADAEWTSQTFSTVPAFPSVRATALPTNSACASPYSFRIFDARRFTDGIARPCPSEPSLAQWRGFFQCSAPGTIDDERSSNSRSRLICVLKRAGNSGSGLSDARNLSPIS